MIATVRIPTQAYPRIDNVNLHALPRLLLSSILHRHLRQLSHLLCSNHTGILNVSTMYQTFFLFRPPTCWFIFLVCFSSHCPHDYFYSSFRTKFKGHASRNLQNHCPIYKRSIWHQNFGRNKELPFLQGRVF